MIATFSFFFLFFFFVANPGPAYIDIELYVCSSAKSADRST